MKPGSQTDRPPIYRGWTIPERYESRPSDLDLCGCGGPKTKHASVCIACRRRIGRASRPMAERFWEKVDKSAGPDACWPFTGARDEFGYGRFTVERGRSEKANRVSYRLAYGEIPARLGVLHHCDNPPCVNPVHLYAGTQRQNIRDAIERGRHKAPPRRNAA